MIIWINGAFGSGKTQTAHELHRRLPGSMIYDPENAGFFIRKHIPRALHEPDFQDYPIWREFNYSMLRYLVDRYEGSVIVPMTIVNRAYFAEIAGRLRAEGKLVHHFTLQASKDVLLRRLRSRGDGATSWPARQIDRCIEGLADPAFEIHLDTNRLSIDDVVNEIAARLKVTLLPDERSAFRKKVDRLVTKLKHIRS